MINGREESKEKERSSFEAVGIVEGKAIQRSIPEKNDKKPARKRRWFY